MKRSRAELEATVLAVLGPQPLSAYQISAAVPAGSGRLKPPQVYRVLDRLVRDGAVRRIELAKGYVRKRSLDHLALSCGRCGGIAFVPAPSVTAALARHARLAGFTVGNLVVECDGLCAPCAEARLQRDQSTSRPIG